MAGRFAFMVALVASGLPACGPTSGTGDKVDFVVHWTVNGRQVVEECGKTGADKVRLGIGMTGEEGSEITTVDCINGGYAASNVSLAGGYTLVATLKRGATALDRQEKGVATARKPGLVVDFDFKAPPRSSDGGAPDGGAPDGGAPDGGPRDTSQTVDARADMTSPDAPPAPDARADTSSSDTLLPVDATTEAAAEDAGSLD